MSEGALVCQEAALVDRHFAGRIDEAGERRMREHLPTCDSCRARYDRHGILAKLDPASLSAQERLGLPLGFAAAEVRAAGKRSWTMVATFAAAAAICLLVFGRGVLRARHDEAAGFASRGGNACMKHVRMTRVQGAALEPVVSEMHASDELGFAYENAAGKRFFMAFAVDSAHAVHWYFPAWQNPNERPSSTQMVNSAEWTALPEVVRHPLSNGPLRMLAVTSDRSLRVDEVERALEAGGDPEAALRRAFADRGVDVDACSLQVSP